jgi:hypothetical protein
MLFSVTIEMGYSAVQMSSTQNVISPQRYSRNHHSRGGA